MVLVYITLGIVAIVLSYIWCKFVFAVFGKVNSFINRKKIAEKKNPYIVAQKIIYDNDRKYEEYLSWMSYSGDGVPLDKIMSKEEFIAEQKINQLLR